MYVLDFHIYQKNLQEIIGKTFLPLQNVKKIRRKQRGPN